MIGSFTVLFKQLIHSVGHEFLISRIFKFLLKIEFSSVSIKSQFFLLNFPHADAMYFQREKGKKNS